MEANTRAIVELAWARLLGLDDGVFAESAPDRITRVDDSLITFVTLWRHRVLIGPQWFLDVADDHQDRSLASGPALLSLSAGRGSRLVEDAVLSFTDGYVRHASLSVAVVTDDPQASAELERQCPPDDVTEVGLSSLAQRFVTVDELDQVRAGAGYDEVEGILAQVGALTPPHRRRSGCATLAAAIATNDALDSGLVPQWRTRRDSVASLALLRRLGYQVVGSQTTVLLSAQRPALG